MAKQSKSKPEKPDSDNKEKAGFTLPSILLRKIKYISAVEDQFQGDIVEEALTKYVNDWEKKNGDIKLK